MKRILLTTTSLVLAAGVASAEVTFSGKMEAGVSRTAKTAAVAVVAGRLTTSASNTTVTAAAAATAAATATADVVQFVDGVLTTTTAGGTLGAVAANAAAGSANVVSSVNYATQDVADKKAALADAEAALRTLPAATTQANIDGAIDTVAGAKADLARAEAVLAGLSGTAAKAAGKAGDMVAYSGYDMNVAVSSTLDNGMVVSAGFDMGAGSIADRDDDRVLDAQGASVALSSVTIKNGGVTYVIGNDEIDDLYDDTQNGDVSVSGAAGGVSYTLVADLDKDTKAVAASTTYAAGSGTIGSAAYVNATYTETAAVAAVYESTSLKLSGAAGGLDWTFTTTNKNDRGNAASKVSLGYAAGDALSFTLTHDTQGKREAINTLKASYTMDAITLTATMADDKNHAGNTNKGGKASQNLTIAYANGPLSASFNNDESSAWWATTSYDLGNGADLFATVDHEEFAVVGLSFNF